MSSPSSVAEPIYPASDTSSASTSVSSSWQHLDHQALCSILASRRGFGSIIQLEGEDAAAVVEILDRTLDSPDLNSALRNNCTVALRRLCSKCGILPTSCILTDDLEKISDAPHASGGFADVWPGRYSGGRLVAIKVLRTQDKGDDLFKRFCKEVLVWKHLSHPNVVPFLGVSFSPPQFSMVSTWMTHGDIIAYVKKHPDANRILLLLDVASGLAYLHANNLVHGDLKGANILINNDYRACLADFGLMVVLHDSLYTYTTTVASEGTIRWMAPELLMQEESKRCKPSKESDMYAIGMVIYEVMTGNIPFHEYKKTWSVLLKVMAGARPCRPVVPGLSDDLWQIAERCWRPEQGERPPISRVLSHLKATTRYWIPPSPIERTPDLGGTGDDCDTSSTTSGSFISIDGCGTRPSTHSDDLPITRRPIITFSLGQSPSNAELSPLTLSSFVGIESPLAASDSSPSTTSESLSESERSGVITRALFGERRRSQTGGSQEGIESIGRNQKTLKGVMIAIRMTLFRPRNPEGHLSSPSSPPIDPHKSNSKANDLVRGFRKTHKLEDLREAISHYKEALAVRALYGARSASSNNLAVALVELFRRTHKVEYVDEAVKCYREALVIRHPGHPDRQTSLYNISAALLDRFRRTRDQDDLKVAMIHAREVLDLHPNQINSLNAMARAMHYRFEQSRSVEDLKEAEKYSRKALGLCAPGHVCRCASLNNVVRTIHSGFELSKKVDELDEAITYSREALELNPPGHLFWFDSLIDLAVAIMAQFKQMGSINVLHEAANLLAVAEATVHADCPTDIHIKLHNLRQAIDHL